MAEIIIITATKSSFPASLTDYFYRVRSLGPSVSKTPFADLTDNANMAIQGNVAMQVTQPSGQLWQQCKWCQMAKF